MKTFFQILFTSQRWQMLVCLAACCAVLAGLAGCTALDEKQRAWIFQPSDRTWGGGLSAASGMQDIWIDVKNPANSAASIPVSLSGAGVSHYSGPERIHGLWLAAATQLTAAAPDNFDSLAASDSAPVLLYLHGARYNVTGSAPRIRRMQELGFSVLAIDYRGFGKSSAGLPSEASAYADAQAAWQWLALHYPERPRYIFGHSLGGPIAIDLASRVSDESGVIVESTFTSIADVVETSTWGWLPVSLLITQRFEAERKVSLIGSPLLVVHGSQDGLIQPRLGRKLYDAASAPKKFLLVEGASHHNTNLVGQVQYRQALQDLFGLQNPSSNAPFSRLPKPA